MPSNRTSMGARLRVFVAELHRRRLIGTVTAYSIGAWVLVQVASVVLPAFEAPSWALRATIIAAFAGVPVVLLLGWMFDLTMHGLVRTRDLEAPATDTPDPAPPDALPGDPPAPSSDGGPERRQVTILYAAVSVRGPHEEATDPEVEREVLPAVREACARVAEEFGGYVGTATGHDLTVYFGAPVAHEDDALRAVRAGLAMIEAVGGLNLHWAEGLSQRAELRITVHTGTVVAESAAGGTAISLVGDAVKVPAAMQFHARPEDVLISGATHHLIESMVACEDRGQAILGPRTSEHLLRVSAVVDGRGRHSDSKAVEFVGRAREQALLEEKWSLARAGAGQAVLVSGEPGIGKSLIVQRVADLVGQEPGARVLFGQCSPYHQQRSLYPIAGLLTRDLIHLEAEGDETARARKLEAFLVAAGLEPATSMPLFGPLLSLAQPYPPLQLAPDLQQRMLLEQLVGVLIEGSEQAPLLLVIEDLHWADTATQDFVTLLLDQLPAARVLLLLTFRPEFNPKWGTRSNMVHLAMSRLPQEAAKRIVERIAGDRPMPARLIEKIVERADGVPLFLEELTKSVLEAGTADHPGPDGELRVAIPETLQESLAARLDRLGPTKRLAQIAATIGREFTYPLLAAVAEIDASTLDRWLEELVAGEFVYRKGIGQKARYTFKHALIQDAAYESLLKSRRREYHGKIAAALETGFPEVCQGQPELLALHFGEAALHEPAARYGLAAGQQAVRRAANKEAVYYLRRSLEALKHVPPGPSRNLVELGVQMTLMPAVVATTGYGNAELERTCSRALELCEVVGDVPERIFAVFGLWMFHVVRANHRESVELAMKFDGLARASGDDDLLVEAELIVGIAHFFIAELDRAVRSFEACVARYDPVRHGDHAYRYGQDPRTIALSYLSWAYWLRGEHERSLRASAEAVAAARALNHPLTLSFALSFAGWLRAYRGEFAEARVLAEEVERLCTDYGILTFLAHARVILAWVAADGAGGEPSCRRLLARIDEFLAVGARCFVPMWESHAAELCLDAGEIAEAEAVMRRAEQRASATGEHWSDEPLKRVRNRLLRAHEENRPVASA